MRQTYHREYPISEPLLCHRALSNIFTHPTVIMPSPCNHFLRIFTMRSYLQMLRITAVWINTLMKYKQSIRYEFAVYNLPNGTIGKKRFTAYFYNRTAMRRDTKPAILNPS